MQSFFFHMYSIFFQNFFKFRLHQKPTCGIILAYTCSYRADAVGEAAKQVGISRSAFYKYKDAVQPFQNMHAGRIITFYALLKDIPGVLSNYLSIFANSGANILTINQTIPTNGCAGVTISAETSEMVDALEELMARAASAEGVLKFEILAG